MNSIKSNIRKFFFGLIVLGAFPLWASAQRDSIVEDFKTLFAENIRSLGELYFFSDAQLYPGTFRFDANTDFEKEFGKMDLPVFPELMPNAVKYYRFLDSLPLQQQQNLVRYFSFFDKEVGKQFEAADMPPALKYLAPTLSAMNRYATGPGRRAGVWQLTHFQAVLNGLKIDNLIDERLDERLATAAFLQVMKQNIDLFESPELAVLAYALGNAKVKNALSFAGEDASLKEVLANLPASTVQFIAAFQATAVFLHQNRFKPKTDPFVKARVPDTVKINQQVHLRQISDVLHISQNQLQFFNPKFKFSVVPGDRHPMKVIIPEGKWDDFVVWQDSIYNAYDSTLFVLTTQKIEYPPAPGRQYLGEPVKNLEIEGKTKLKYTLKSGDVLGIIAEMYDVAVADLKYWNNISNERRIQAGKSLDIFIDDDKVADYEALANKSEKKKPLPSEIKVEQFMQKSTLPVFEELNTKPKVEHVVKNGESPFTIAKKYDGVSPEQILEWNNISDARKIQIGQKLTIYLLK